jgi:hypothetical protein
MFAQNINYSYFISNTQSFINHVIIEKYLNKNKYEHQKYFFR